MPNITFYKYQATGNDFVMLDGTKQYHQLNQQQIAFLCNRHFGIGADGLIVIAKHPDCDFEMIYYNADGNQSSMCGNGGRSAVMFAAFLGIVNANANFIAIDGLHKAKISNNQVHLQMQNVSKVNSVNENQNVPKSFFLNTGSPHHVQFVNELNDFDVYSNGKKIRNQVYGKEGANVNFVELVDEQTIQVRTYERGVEDETLSCGTGVTAAAIASVESNQIKQNKINIKTMGGDLVVQFDVQNNQYQNIWLTGPAKQVFSGTINLDKND